MQGDDVDIFSATKASRRWAKHQTLSIWVSEHIGDERLEVWNQDTCNKHIGQLDNKQL